MKQVLIGLMVALLLSLGSDIEAATCTGSPNCRACTNCSRCAHCKNGGTCGVCARPAVRSDPPTPTAKTPVQERRPAASAPTTKEPLQDAKSQPATQPTTQATVSVYFSPKGGCTDAVVREIRAAKKSIQVQAYRLTSTPVAAALAAAHERGVEVIIVLDKSTRSPKYSDATYFFNKGIPVFIDDVHAIAHNKVVLVDDEMVITGSFNFTAAAEQSNAENLLILKSRDLSRTYEKNFDAHRSHSKKYTGLAPPGSTSQPPAAEEE
jgi:phosphatidylserine/phosphatidylglycerophosphate/cardiolipin synthase-like enzyme